MILIRLGPKRAANIIVNTIVGITRKESVTRISKSSSNPPTYPEIRPIKPPRPALNKATTIPTKRDPSTINYETK